MTLEFSRDAKRAAKAWDAAAHSESVAPAWTDVPAVLRAINRRVSGDPEVDWLEYVQSAHLGGMLPVERVLSLGCGTGHVERRMARRGWFRTDACDVSDRSLVDARRHAEDAGVEGICYLGADMNALDLVSESYDLIVAHASVHHCNELERLFSRVRRALRPGCRFVITEYIGPSRWAFEPRRIELMNAVLRLIPDRNRVLSGVPSTPASLSKIAGTDMTQYRIGGPGSPSPQRQ